MDAGEMLNSITSSTGGMLGAIAAFMAAAAVVFKKYVRSEKEDGAGSSARVDMLEKFQGLLDKAYARADLADARADKANAERNEMVAKVGEMTAQVAAMRIELTKMDAMRTEIERLTNEVTTLRKIVRAEQN